MEEQTPSNDIRTQRQSSYKKIVKWMWAFFIMGFVGFFAILILLAYSDLPTFEQLENPNSNVATEVIADNGEVIGRFFIENRVPVEYKDLSPHLVTALISTEDERFKKHSGIDGRALFRVLVKTVFLQDQSGGGGSTVSQQLAKLLFPRRNFKDMNALKKYSILVKTKLQEWLTAVKLERSYTKEEIIAMYFNKFNFINGAYGIKSASEIYFGTSPDSLKMEEAALLVGMLKNPAYFNPNRFPERSKGRRNQVFFQMARAGAITQAEKDRLTALPMDMSRYKRSDHTDGLAPYFREELRNEVKKILAENKKPDGSTYNVHRDGLRIYTTINPTMQRHAEAAVQEHFTDLQAKFFKHWEGKDPWTHKVKGTTDGELKMRQNSLKKAIRTTDRYEKIKEKYSAKQQELKLRDADIDRLYRIEKEGKDLLDKWRATGFISVEQFNRYPKILKSPDWKTIKGDRAKMEKAIDAEFAKPVKMSVFAYNKKRQTDTIMSPLDSIRYYRMFLQTGVLAVEPSTGYIRAWVGGPNYNYFKFDHANRRLERQVGSTFKPFLYALSIKDKGFSPCYRVPDIRQIVSAEKFHMGKDWAPKNASGKYSGNLMTLREGLKKSKNSVSAFLMNELGTTRPLRALVSRMGIDSAKVPTGPAICLGTPSLSVFEMTGAYTTFANNGTTAKPIFITRIEDRNGNTIYSSAPELVPSIEEGPNYVMVDMLRYVVRGAGGFGGIRSDVGGKTGTTNNHADGWFMGVTPNIVVGTWVGCDDRFIRFRTLGLGQGAKMARPIFAKFLTKVEADTTISKDVFDVKKRFKMPDRELDIELNCDKYDSAEGGILDEGNEFDEDEIGDGGEIGDGDDFGDE